MFYFVEFREAPDQAWQRYAGPLAQPLIWRHAKALAELLSENRDVRLVPTLRAPR